MEIYDSAGVDLTLIRWMLSLSIAERLDFLEGSIDFAQSLRARHDPDAIQADLPEIR
jgi:hypothetical protein